MPRLMATIYAAVFVAVVVAVVSSGPVVVVAAGGVRGEGATLPDASGGSFCQWQCPCLGNAIDCSKKNLKTLLPIPHWVDNLDLASNRLSHDTISAQLADLRKLQELSLNFNRLKRLPVLRGLPNLTKLLVNNNEIETIDPDALKALPGLKFLDLSRNAIRELQFASFPVKNILQYVNLNFNQLTVLTKGTFDRLQSLKRLEISSNALEEVQSLTFRNLNQLKSLKLNNNRIPALMDGVFHGLLAIGTLELNNNTIAVIRKGGFFNMTSLTNLALARNRIAEIEQSGWEFAPKLISLDLAHNRLEALDRHTFEELSSLHTLNLQGNRIAAIGEGTFNETKSLETLYLNGNRISWTIEDMRGPFVGLNRLERLYLNANEIKSVSRNAFLGLKSLTLLELSQNNISSIQDNAFKDTIRLKNLILNSTSLICDCNLVWFFHWIKERRDVFQIDAECIYPIWLRNRLIRDLHPSNFSCYDSPKPHLIEEPKSQMFIHGSDVTLACTANSTAADRMTVKWRQDDHELPAAQYTVEQRTGENGTIARSELTIVNIQQPDVGKYQCIITNSYGVVYSQKVRVTVGTYPQFSKVPSDVSVQSGKVVRLDCAALGEPKPQIAWDKDGGNEFPAALERRMRLETDTLLILDAQAVDQGVYTCTAENAAGIVRANASLVVFGQRSPTVLEIPLGKASVLECKANVSRPKSDVFWLKDGEPVGLSTRHFITGEGLLLVIVDTELADAGLYECRFENELNVEDGSSMRLIVSEQPEDMHGSVPGDVVGPPPTYGVPPSMGEDEENRAQFLDPTLLVVMLGLFVCVLLTSLVWWICLNRMRKRIRGTMGGHGGGETVLDLATGMEVNQPNLIVRSGVGTSTTPAGYFEYLIPMVRNGQVTTNVDEDGESADGCTIGRDARFYKPVATTKTRHPTELDSDDLDDDLSSKDSGTGGDCASASGSTNAAQRGSREDLKCLLHSLTRKHSSDVDLHHHHHNHHHHQRAPFHHPGRRSHHDPHDPDEDPRIEPPPPIPPVNATTTVLMVGTSTIPPTVARHDDRIPAPAAFVATRMPNSQTFPSSFGPQQQSGGSALRTSSLESSADPVLPPKPPHPTQGHQQIQVNQLYQLLLENPRLVEKPAKYRTKSVAMEKCHDNVHDARDYEEDEPLPPTPASSGIGTGSSASSNGSTMNGESGRSRRVAAVRAVPSDVPREVNR